MNLFQLGRRYLVVQQRHQLRQFSDGIPLHLVGVHLKETNTTTAPMEQMITDTLASMEKTLHLVEVPYALTGKQVMVVEQQETSPDSEIAEHCIILKYNSTN